MVHNYGTREMMMKILAVVVLLFLSVPSYAADCLGMAVDNGTRYIRPDSAVRVTPNARIDIALSSCDFTFPPNASATVVSFSVELKNAHPSYALPMRLEIWSVDPNNPAITTVPIANQPFTLPAAGAYVVQQTSATIPPHSNTLMVSYQLRWGNATAIIPAFVAPVDVRSVIAGGNILRPEFFPRAPWWETPVDQRSLALERQ